MQSSTSLLSPRANATQPSRGRCASTVIPAHPPRRKMTRVPRCVIHARRRPAVKARPGKPAASSCRCATAQGTRPGG